MNFDPWIANYNGGGRGRGGILNNNNEMKKGYSEGFKVHNLKNWKGTTCNDLVKEDSTDAKV